VGNSHAAIVEIFTSDWLGLNHSFESPRQQAAPGTPARAFALFAPFHRPPRIAPPIRASNCREAYIRRAASIGSIGLPPITADKIACGRFCCVPGPREAR
jgi:hypothetical protein